MSSTTAKHRNFVGEPMRDKPVTELPGIGTSYGVELAANGYSKCEKVYGQYLLADKSQEKFTGWLHDTAGVDPRNANNCYQGLNDYNKFHS